MMPLMRCWWLVFVSSVALAQTPRALFDEGTALYAKGQFAKAAEKFEASFAARPVPVTKFNIARSWEQAGETLKAVDAWQAWLVMSPAAAERPDAERSLQKLGEKLAKLGVQALTITSLPLAARVSVDGVPRGLAPLTVELTPTRHLVRVELEGREPTERTLEVQLTQPRVEAFELAPLGTSTRVATVERAPLPSPSVPSALEPTPLPRPVVPRPTDPEFAFALSEEAVQVHLEADDGEARLYRVNGNPNGECRAPCDAPVTRASDLFVVGGSGIVPSSTFVLLDHRKHGHVSLKVRTGSAGWFFGGGTLLSTAAIAGLIIGIVFAASSSSFSDRTLTAGLGIGIGIASGIGAAVVYATNTTTVTFDE